MMWLALLKKTFDAFDAFKRFTILPKCARKEKIGCLRNDQGGEFTSKELYELCYFEGVKKQLTTPYSSQQNGVDERRNTTILNMLRCMLISWSLMQELGGEATYKDHPLKVLKI